MVEVGEAAPDFTLPSTAGGEVSLAAELRTGPVVVVTNRGHWCSYCAEQLGTYSALAYDLWRHLDVNVLPIVGDPVPKLVEMRGRFDLKLQLLSDVDLEVVPEYAGTEQTERFGEIPLAGTFVIDGEGTVRYAHVAENPADRTYANYVRHFVREGFVEPYADG